MEYLEWPFRPSGEFIERFNQRTRKWETTHGSVDSSGYMMLTWASPSGRVFKRAHTVCWMTHKGAIPEGFEIDHINGDKADNRVSNLRLVTHRDNILFARERLGNWSQSAKMKPHQIDLLLAIPEGWRCLRALSIRWGMSKGSLANMRSLAKLSNDIRYLATL